jgi:spore germination protein YaaH
MPQKRGKEVTLCLEEMEQDLKEKVQEAEEDKETAILMEDFFSRRVRTKALAEETARAKAGAGDKARAKALERAVVIDNHRKTIKKKGGEDYARI